jgi:hypothetical protein
MERTFNWEIHFGSWVNSSSSSSSSSSSILSLYTRFYSFFILLNTKFSMSVKIVNLCLILISVGNMVTRTDVASDQYSSRPVVFPCLSVMYGVVCQLCMVLCAG